MNDLQNGDVVYVSCIMGRPTVTILTCVRTRSIVQWLPDYTCLCGLGNDVLGYYRWGYRDGRKPDPDFIAFDDGEVIIRDHLGIGTHMEILSIPKPSEYFEKRAYEYINGSGSWEKR